MVENAKRQRFNHLLTANKLLIWDVRITNCGRHRTDIRFAQIDRQRLGHASLITTRSADDSRPIHYIRKCPSIIKAIRSDRARAVTVLRLILRFFYIVP